MEELVRQLHELLYSSLAMEPIIRSANAAPERRIAALIIHVAGSRARIGAPVTELLLSLTDPEWPRSISQPAKTTIGRAVIAHLHDSPHELQRLRKKGSVSFNESAAAQLIMRSLAGDYSKTEHLDIVLKAISGRDAVWWIDWITARRS